jgi:hypothetical protein
MRTLSLSIIAALSLAGITAFGQMGQGSAPRGSYSAPSHGTYSSGSSSGGSYSSSPSRGSYGSGSSSTPSRPSSGSDSGSSGSTYSGSGRNGSSGSSSSGSSSSGSSGAGNTYNNGYYNSGYYNGGYYNNNGYYNTGGYSNTSTGVGSSSPASSSVGSSGSSTGATNNSTIAPDDMRNFAKQDIRKALSQFDRTSQQYTVSGTTPSTVTGLGGTIMNINPADLETVDGQPIKGDINVELKELDSPDKMALAGAPTMSNGDVLISGGSYYFGMTSGGQDVRLRQGQSMEVTLPKTVNDPDMQVYMGEVDKNGTVNWQPTGRPLTDLGYARGGSNNNGTGSGSGNENGTGSGSTGSGSGTRPTAGTNNNSNTNTGNNAVGGSAVAFYNPTRINSLGWVNADKGNRGGCKMFVEVEGVDPTTTQVFVMYKDVKTLVEGKPEQGFSTNKFVFENIPANQPVRIVAVSKAFGTVYAGQMEAKTKARAKFTLPLKRSSDSEAADMFKTK